MIEPGLGEETRDLTFVEDIVDGVLRCGVMPEAVGGAFNLASSVETKIIDLANLINELTANQAGVKFIERRRWDKIVKRRASIDKAKNELGYNPKTKIADGVRKTLAWFEENKDKIEASARF